MTGNLTLGDGTTDLITLDAVSGKSSCRNWYASGGPLTFGAAITFSRNISTGLVTITDATTEPYTQGFAFELKRIQMLTDFKMVMVVHIF